MFSKAQSPIEEHTAPCQYDYIPMGNKPTIFPKYKWVGPPLWSRRYNARSVTQRARLRSLVGTSFLGVFPHVQDKYQENLGPQDPRISFGSYNNPFILALLQWMGAWTVCIFHVHVVLEMDPALSWSLIRGGPPCLCVIKSLYIYIYVCVCVLFKVNSLSRQVMTL